MWVLFLGDVVGEPGRKGVREFLARLPARRDVDLVIANGENAASGNGVTASVLRELFSAGIDVLTGGNHIWDKKEGVPFVRDDERILRPANYPPGVDGRGWAVYRGRSGREYAVVSLIGRVFMGTYDCPFRWIEESLPAIGKVGRPIIVDFHAEATSEKRAMGFHLDGRVSAVLGTHTHVRTADAQLLPRGTAYITDAGMCGPGQSVIGVSPDIVLRRFLTQLPTRFETAAGEPEVSGVFLEIDAVDGRCLGIESFTMSETQMRSADAWKIFSRP
ncbi:MAG TPA: TIGR00282 family metallophosphoesterase [Candidatus Deferrimicrobiaceae bacterium]